MPTSNTVAEPLPVNSAAGHLSVHLEGAHPVEVSFLFEQREKRLGGAFVASLISHLTMGVLFFIVIKYGSNVGYRSAVLPEDAPQEIVWLAEPGAGGGGGGGGNQMKEPPRKAELPGKDKITVPVMKQPEPQPTPQQTPVEANPAEQLNIPAKELASATDSLVGMLQAPEGPPTLSQGSGSGGGAGTGTGTGIGSGRGSGLGPGYGGGTGGGAYRPGNGVSLPQLLREVKPAYTSDAMRAKIQGTVLLECVVEPNGDVTNIQVLRSLDPTFGLDQEAIKAAKQWRFRPGMRMGQPVPVVITIELTFTLR